VLGTLIERGVMRDGRVVARLLRRTFALIDRLPPTAACLATRCAC
jgi:hypothetical protein